MVRGARLSENTRAAARGDIIQSLRQGQLSVRVSDAGVHRIEPAQGCQRAGVRKPPKNEPAGQRASSWPAMGIWSRGGARRRSFGADWWELGSRMMADRAAPAWPSA